MARSIPRPGIESVTGKTIRFTDGSIAEYDAVIAATGYITSFPFFDRDFLNWENTAHIPLYLRIFHPDHPSLFFIGLIQPQGCIWTLAEAQSRLVSQFLTSRVCLPDNWQTLAVTEGKYWAQQFLARPRHSLEVHYYPYLMQIQRLPTQK